MNDHFTKQRIALALAAPELGKTLIVDSTGDDSLRIKGASGWVRSDGAVLEHVRGHLIERGDWDAKAEVIVVDTARIRGFAAEFGDDYEEALLSVILHEAAHLLPKRPTAPEQRPIVSADDEDFVTMQRTGYDQARDFVPWGSHGPKFHRIAVHLVHRIQALNYPVAADFAFGGMGYRLPPTWQLVEALGDEPQRMLGRSFREIEAADPPAAFVELFEASAAFYRAYMRAK